MVRQVLFRAGTVVTSLMLFFTCPTAEMTRILSERGRKYTKIAKNANYMQYAPGSFFFKMRPVRSGGRLMIDTGS
jgi:hypothetical protein